MVAAVTDTTAISPSVITREEAERVLREAGHLPRVEQGERAAGWRMFTDHDGAILVTWLPARNVPVKPPTHLANESKRMADEYAAVARAAGWRTEFGGIYWRHVRFLPPAPDPDPASPARAEQACERDVIEIPGHHPQRVTVTDARPANDKPGWTQVSWQAGSEHGRIHLPSRTPITIVSRPAGTAQ